MQKFMNDHAVPYLWFEFQQVNVDTEYAVSGTGSPFGPHRPHIHAGYFDAELSSPLDDFDTFSLALSIRALKITQIRRLSDRVGEI